MATATAPRKSKLMRFRLLDGRHYDRATDGNGNFLKRKERDAITGQVMDNVFEMKTYNPGEYIDTDNDLTRFNSRGSIRFEKVEVEEGQFVFDPKHETIEEFTARIKAMADNSAVKQASDYAAFEAMNVTELQKWAKDEAIDLKGAKDKSAILAIIKATL